MSHLTAFEIPEGQSYGDGWRKIVLDKALDAVIGIDDRGIIIEWNTQAEIMFGFCVKEATGRSLTETIIPESDRKAFINGLERFRNTGEGRLLNRRVEMQALHRDGTLFPVELTVIPIFLNGSCVFYSFVRDITERKRTETGAAKLISQLGDEHKWLEALLNLMPMPLLLVEPGRALVHFANKAADELAGGSFPRDREAESYCSTFHCCDEQGQRVGDDFHPIARAVRGELVNGVESRWNTSTGVRILLVYSQKLSAMYGHDETIVIGFLDVTRLKEIESQIQAALSARNEFISIAGHELKTPLTSLKLQTELLKRALGTGDQAVLAPEKLQRTVETTTRQLDRLSRLVDDMLDITRISNGRLPLQVEEVDLCELVKDIGDRFSHQLSAAGCKLDIKLGNDVKGRWDKFRIEQVLVNLLTNVTKYAPGSAIEISVGKANGKANLAVSDKGPGIAREQQEKIFECFERGSTSGKISGLGLGLYIVKKIVEAHEGLITVESELGKGATFTVELPAAR